MCHNFYPRKRKVFDKLQSKVKNCYRLSPWEIMAGTSKIVANYRETPTAPKIIDFPKRGFPPSFFYLRRFPNTKAIIHQYHYITHITIFLRFAIWRKKRQPTAKARAAARFSYYYHFSLHFSFSPLSLNSYSSRYCRWRMLKCNVFWWERFGSFLFNIIRFMYSNKRFHCHWILYSGKCCKGQKYFLSLTHKCG